MSRSTRVEVTLSCGCTRRMPRGTAGQRLTDKKTGQCAEHPEARVTSIPGPEALANLLRF